jgi:fumarate hydratase class II
MLPTGAAQVSGNHLSIMHPRWPGASWSSTFSSRSSSPARCHRARVRPAVAVLAAAMARKLASNREHIAENPAKPRMLVTALNPRIGYDKAVKFGRRALGRIITPRSVAATPGSVWPEDFDRPAVPAATTAAGASLDGGGG